MQQFVIPQFIDVEDKIIGPITTRQFVILVIAGLLIFLSYRLADFALFITEGIIIFALAGTFAFLKINGQPFYYFLLNVIQTLRKPKLRTWQKEYRITELKQLMETPKIEIKEVGKALKIKPPLSRLSELTLIIDTGGAYRGEE